MVIRQLEPALYDRVYKHLMTTAYLHPMEVACTVILPAERGEYQVKILPEDHSLAVLQAVRVYREPDYPWFVLITDTPTLSAFLDRLMARFS